MPAANTRYFFTDVVGEGPCSDFTAKGCYFNKKVVQNADNSYNYDDYNLDIKYGYNTADLPEGHEISESPVSVGNIELKYNQSYTSPQVSDIDGFKFILYFPALFIMDRKSGAYHPGALTFRVQVRDYAGGGSPVTTHTVGDYRVTNAQASAFQKQISFYGFEAGDFGSGPWDVRLTRLSPDFDQYSHFAASSYVSYYSPIVNSKIYYYDRIVVRGEFDMEEFGGQRPVPHYYGKWLVCEVPSGYTDNGSSATYPGTWNGQWVSGWTNNPAFIWRFLAKHDRFGGKIAESLLPSDGVIYSFAQYCDETVEDGKGGNEKRFALNGVIEKQSDADHVLGLIASVFRSTPYYGVNGVGLFMDKPLNDDPIPITNANVIEGRFTQSSLGGKDRFTIANVDFTNKEVWGERDRVIVEATPEIRAKYGDKTIDVAAVFCDSYGQAQRMGRNTIQTSLSQNKLMSFSGVLDMAHLMPGTLVQIADKYTTTDNRDAGGRLRSITNAIVEIDRKITYLTTPSDWELHLLQPDLTPVVKDVVSIDNTGTYSKITVSSSYSSQPIPHSTWQLVHKSSNVDIFKWVLLTNQEDDNNPLIHHFTAIRYDADKFPIVDGESDFDDGKYIPATKLDPPQNLDINYRATPDGQHGVVFSWERGDDNAQFYDLELKDYYIDDSTGNAVVSTKWIKIGVVIGEEYFHYPIVSGQWAFRVRSNSPFYDPSTWATSSTTTINIGDDTPDPPDIGNVWCFPGTYPNTTWNGRDCVITWDEPDWTAYNRKYFRHYKIVVKTDQDGSMSTLKTDYVTTNLFKYRYDENTQDSIDDGYSGPVRELTFEVYAEDIFDQVSASPGNLSCSNPAPSIPVAPVLRSTLEAVEATWVIPSDNDGKEFEVFMDGNNPPTTSIAIVPWGTNFITKTGLDTQTPFFCRILPSDEFGPGDYSPTSASSTPTAIGIDAIQDMIFEGISHEDSLGTSASTLAKLRDGNLTSDGVSYGTNTGWRWIQTNFPRSKLVDKILIYSQVEHSFYGAYSTDGTTWNYLKNDGSGNLTAATDQADAQSNSVYPAIYNIVVDIDVLIDAPYWRIYFYQDNETALFYEIIWIRTTISETIYTENLYALSAEIGNGVVHGAWTSANYPTGKSIKTDFSNANIEMRNDSGEVCLELDTSGVNVKGAITVLPGSGGYDNLSDAPQSLADLDNLANDKLNEMKRNPPNLIGECVWQLAPVGATNNGSTYGNWVCTKSASATSSISDTIANADEYIDKNGKYFNSYIASGTSLNSGMRSSRYIPIDDSKVYCMGFRAKKGYSNSPKSGLGFRYYDEDKVYQGISYPSQNIDVGWTYDTHSKTIGPSGSGADHTWPTNTYFIQPIFYGISPNATGPTNCLMSWVFFCEGEEPPDYVPTSLYLQSLLNIDLDLEDIGAAIFDPIQRAITYGSTLIAGGLLRTDVAVITTAAQIANALIVGGHLQDLTISGAKIQNSEITNSKVYGYAELNGRQLTYAASGTGGGISGFSSVFVTHNLGRYGFPRIVGPQATSLISYPTDINNFAVYNNTASSVTSFQWVMM